MKGVIWALVALPLAARGDQVTLPAVDATFVTTRVTLSDDRISTAVILSGGPLPSAVTLTAARTETLQPDAPQVTSYLRDISTAIASTVVPSISATYEPDSPAATSAAEALDNVVVQVAELAHELPYGSAIFDCLMTEEDEMSRKISQLGNRLREMTCELLSLLQNLGDGASLSPDLLLADLDSLVAVAGIEGATGSDGPVAGQPGSIAPSVVDPTDLAGPSETSPGSTGDTGADDGATDGGTSDAASGTEGPPSDPSSTPVGAAAPPPAAEPTAPGPVTETVTELPPAASLVTLSDTTITENTWITTTREGSDEQTVIPVLLPGPVAVFGAFSGPSLHGLQLNLPGLPCVQLFGLKIFGCPSESPTQPAGDPDNDPDSSSQLSSCTTTTTAIYASVLCKVTAAPDQHPGLPEQPGQGEEERRRGRRQETTESCSTIEYKTETSCGATGSTTTVTSTEEPNPTKDVCACDYELEGACQASVTDQEQAGDPLSKRATDAEPLSTPPDGEWFGAENYGSIRFPKKNSADLFMRGHTRKIARGQYPDSVTIPLDRQGLKISTAWRMWGDKVQDLAIPGLSSCNFGVIVVSQRGAWAARVRNNCDQTDLQNALSSTLGQPGIELGLGHFCNNDYHPYDPLSGQTFPPYDPKGYEVRPGHILDDPKTTRAFIVHPTLSPSGTTVEALERGNLAAQVIFDVTGVTAEWLWYGGLPNRDPAYKPPSRTLIDNPSDKDYGTSQGKFLVQNKPAKFVLSEDGSCDINPTAWRLWAQKAVPEPGSSRYDEWLPFEGQILGHGNPLGKFGGARNRVRAVPEEAACELPSSSSSSPSSPISSSDGPDEPIQGFDGPIPGVGGPVPVCTTAMTTTLVSTFCTVATAEARQSGAPGRRQEASEDCSTMQFTTVTSCGDNGQTEETLISAASQTTDDSQATDASQNTNPSQGTEPSLGAVGDACQVPKDCRADSCHPGLRPICTIEGKCDCEEKPASPSSTDAPILCVVAGDCIALVCKTGQGKTCERNECHCVDPPSTVEPGPERLPCNVHLTEYGIDSAVAPDIAIFDHKGKRVVEWKPEKGVEWGFSKTFPPDGDGLDYDVTLEFPAGQPQRRQVDPRPELDKLYQDFVVHIKAGETAWTSADRDQSALPRCEVGDWDVITPNGAWPNRQMDCRWKC